MDRRQRRLLERQQARGQAGPLRPISSVPPSRPPVPSPSPALDETIQEALTLAQQRRAGGQQDEARQLYAGILEIRADHSDALLGLAQIAKQAAQLDGALAILARGIAVHPQSGVLQTEHATVLRLLHRLDEATVGYRRAAELLPLAPAAWNNLGTVLYERGQPAEAQRAFQRAIKLDPTYARGHYGLGLALLMLGDLAQGYAEHEWRWKLPGYTSEGETFFQTFWDGSDLAGRTILLHDEQGFGDTLQYVRYVPLVKARGGRVIVRCQPPLGRLLAGSVGADRVVSQVRGVELPDYDVHAPLMSLPHLLGTTLTTIPKQMPYLRPDEHDTDRWSARLASDKGFKVGLVWAGSALHANDSRRSLTLDALAPLAQPGVTFYSLQKDGGTAALSDAPSTLPIVDLAPDLHDFAETAAAISQLDLVISVDTAVGHLAGALGRPVWLLLSSVHDARWMTSRESSPWYPGHRLFRQRHAENWEPVIGRVREALREAVTHPPR